MTAAVVAAGTADCEPRQADLRWLRKAAGDWRGGTKKAAVRRWFGAGTKLALAACVAAGCARAPMVSATSEVSPVVTKAGGSLASAHATANPIDAYVGLLEGEGASKVTSGNAVSLLVDGPHAYEAIFEAVAAARHYIDFETYIFEDDELGRRVAEKLIEARRRGVEVNLLVDAIGARATDESFFDWLRAQGIRLVIYNPIGQMEGRKPESPNQRDHRKIIVVDGAVAFTGGINVSEAYSSSAGSAGRAQNVNGTRGWRDTHLRIRGPAVLELQRLFMRTWNDQGGPPLAAKHDAAQARRDGDGHNLVRIVASGDDDNETAIYRMYLAAIGAARRSIHITMAYFVPDRTIIEALMAAARRGVDVQLVLPGFSDFWIVFHAGRAHYAELLDAGVVIHERRDALLHAKTAVIDGIWSTVGSANLDSRSFQLNLEVNAVVLGAPFGGQMQALFVRDVGRSVQITRDGWAARGVVPRIKELIAPLFGYWL